MTSQRQNCAGRPVVFLKSAVKDGSIFSVGDADGSVANRRTGIKSDARTKGGKGVIEGEKERKTPRGRASEWDRCEPCEKLRKEKMELAMGWTERVFFGSSCSPAASVVLVPMRLASH